ncbi:C-type lectin domain family 2 member D-like, partial [Neopelma chrysocephalum]|uniref:C-type lectin domain family 2 member D-like n=1 Tax=Neopelma chrysocephalum TaxID=114329 RepID=UPI000FCD3B04
MGKGTQKPNSSDQEEPLNTCSDPEEQSKCGSYRTKLDWKTFPKERVFLALSVFLGILSLSLAGAVTVLSARPRIPEPEFSHVCPDTWPGFQGKCYYFSKAEGNWSTGRERCEALGASLATISTGDELNFLLRHKGEANHWIGLE